MADYWCDHEQEKLLLPASETYVEAGAQTPGRSQTTQSTETATCAFLQKKKVAGFPFFYK